MSTINKISYLTSKDTYLSHRLLAVIVALAFTGVTPKIFVSMSSTSPAATSFVVAAAVSTRVKL